MRPIHRHDQGDGSTDKRYDEDESEEIGYEVGFPAGELAVNEYVFYVIQVEVNLIPWQPAGENFMVFFHFVFSVGLVFVSDLVPRY